MTTISDHDIQVLADLGGLALSPEEKQSLRQDVERTLSYVDKLAELDTDGVEPTYQVTGRQNAWRADEVKADQVTPDQLISLAAESRDGQIKVPKVL